MLPSEPIGDNGSMVRIYLMSDKGNYRT